MNMYGKEEREGEVWRKNTRMLPLACKDILKV